MERAVVLSWFEIGGMLFVLLLIAMVARVD